MTVVNNVVDNGYCIGCGNCKYVNYDKVSIKLNTYGMYEPKLSLPLDSDENKKFNRICPFSGNSKNEDEFSNELYKDNLKSSINIGKYNKVFVGGISDVEKRVNSSSGGLTSFLIEKLLKEKKVDAVINVASTTNVNKGYFDYVIIDNLSGINKTKKSRYHVVTYADLIEDIINFNGKLAFVGVPCFVKSIRLLSEEIPELKSKIKYHIALFCGHQKSVAYTEYLSSQIVGIDNLNNVEAIDFRVKDLDANADQYLIQINSSSGESEAKRAKEIPWTDWGLGLFKPKACDYCDDVAGEVADVILGDAWIKPYASNPLGTNIVISRNRDIEMIFENGDSDGDIELNTVSEKEVLLAQGGNFRHRKEGLVSRVENKKRNKEWYPERRASLFKNFKLNKKRHELYLNRELITEKSHKAFLKAKKDKDIAVFFNLLSKDVDSYYRLNRSFIKEVKKIIKAILKK